MSTGAGGECTHPIRGPLDVGPLDPGRPKFSKFSKPAMRGVNPMPWLGCLVERPETKEFGNA